MPTVKLDKRKLEELEREVPGRIQAVLSKLAFDTQGRAQQSMEGPRTGRIYYHGGVAHQASAPGEVPAVDTGYLKNTIAVLRVNDRKYLVVVGAEYGIILEYGSVNMAARPFLLPAVRETVRRMPKGLLAKVVEV